MMRIQFLTVLLLSLAFGRFVQAQAPFNAVFSEVKVYDMEDGTGLLEVRVSGSDAAAVTGAEFAVSSPEIPRGSFGSKLNYSRHDGSPGDPSVILVATFPLLPSSSAHREKVNVTLRAIDVAPMYKTESFKRYR